MQTIKKNITGFTLIEVMIVLAIIGLIMAIAAPAYKESIRKGNRSDGVAFITQLANEMEKYYALKNKYPLAADTFSFADGSGRATTADPLLGAGNDFYSEHGYYVAAMVNEAGICAAANSQCYVIEATPRGGQVSDGKMRLFSDGQKWHDFNNDGDFDDTDEKKDWYK